MSVKEDFLKYFSALSRSEQQAIHAEIVQYIKPEKYYLKCKGKEADLAYTILAFKALEMNYQEGMEVVSNPGGEPYLRWGFTDKSIRDALMLEITFLKGGGKDGK
jgi:hypothetical protein